MQLTVRLFCEHRQVSHAMLLEHDNVILQTFVVSPGMSLFSTLTDNLSEYDCLPTIEEVSSIRPDMKDVPSRRSRLGAVYRQEQLHARWETDDRLCSDSHEPENRDKGLAIECIITERWTDYCIKESSRSKQRKEDKSMGVLDYNVRCNQKSIYSITIYVSR